MIRRIAVYLTLVCYGAIALAGQGLHSFVCEHADAHDGLQGGLLAGSGAFADQTPGVCAPSQDDDGCHHDADSCAICQHHSLGQIFVAAPPVEFLLALCELLSPPAPESADSPALFSPAQPRAQPVV